MDIGRAVQTAVATVAAAGSFVGLSPAAHAAPENLTTDLVALWSTVLETPSSRNSFGTGGDAYACWRIGRTVAPLSPSPAGVPYCAVRPGTWLYVNGATYECSTWEVEGAPTVEKMTDCAQEHDATVAPTVTVDGRPVALSEVLTGPRQVTLPQDNVLGQPAGSQGQFVAHGWVALLHPLPPGFHTIVIVNGSSTIRTTIDVGPPAR